MRIKNYRIIYLIIAIFILLSGVCFESNKADSPFECALTEGINSYIQSEDDSITDARLCTTGMLGVHNATRIQQLAVRAFGQKKEAKIFFGFLFISIYSVEHGKYSANSEIIQFYNQCPDELATGFIHKSDGKKKI
ncbi:MAG: hypothetical protein ACI4EF_10680 [Coprococcus sp.]